MAKIDLRSFQRQMAQVQRAAADLPEAAHEEFVRLTPKRSGNAQRQTRLQENKIVADYAYSQRLDEGFSKQAPRGMTEPTEHWIQKEMDRRLKGL